ncbi:MAG: DUF2452 domain-containing protein [Marinirhabdus sp.]|nr:DUF2452 domain-containing protein [Marinirhabdus sp.]
MTKKKSKKPDQVVFNEEKESYDAALKPYSTNLGAPAIQIDDITTWKNTNVNKVNHHFKTKFENLRKEYQAMMESFEHNHLIYTAKFSFEPVIGAPYHLYRDKSGDPFLSIISPSECNWDFVGTFVLNTDKVWQALDNPSTKD